MKSIVLITFILTGLALMAQAQRYTNPPPPRERLPTVMPLPYAEMKQALDQKQAAYDRSIRNCIRRIEELYASFASYPRVLANDSYTVSVTNGENICEEARVSVYNEEITGFEWINIKNGARKVVFSSRAKNGKSIVKIILPDGDTSPYFDVYFIEAISKMN